MNTTVRTETAPRVGHTDSTGTMRGPEIDDSVDLANRLRPVILHLNRYLRRELHSLGVTGGQASLMGGIHLNPGIGVKELAEREGMRSPSVCVQIDRLEKAGMVERVRAAGSDRRRVSLRVTAEGQRVLRTIRSRRTAWLASRLETLSAKERKQIDVALTALTQLIPTSTPR